MTPTAAETRHRQQLDDLGAAALRALAGDATLHFRGHRAWRGDAALPGFAPHLQPLGDADAERGSWRGAVDGLALRLTLSSAAIHLRLAPDDPAERWVFELLEQLRVEALAPAAMPGIASNLQRRFAAWCAAFVRSGLAETERGLALYTLTLVVRGRLSGAAMPAGSEDLIEATRMALVPPIGAALAGLRRERADQAAYAEHALAIARHVAHAVAEDDVIGPDGGQPRAGPFSLWFDIEADANDAPPLAASGHSRALADAGHGYRAFTTAYDVERPAAAGIRRALLDEYRVRLDQRLAQHGLNVARLARELQAVLALPAWEGWEDGVEEGRVDARRLAQLVASPAERRLFRRARPVPHCDVAVTFLIDCSGSIRRWIEPVALLVDLFARALEIAGAGCEVLGFTTAAWNGGRAQRDWQRAGRPRQPGRLNERCHLVFKDACTPWARARRSIAALLKADLFREGVDGEAVDWACDRLLSGAASRRLLLVISDGSPMDSATALANDPHYLDHHLRQVVARREAEGAVEILGLGVGLDLSPFYRRSLAVDLDDGLGQATLSEVVRLVGRRR